MALQVDAAADSDIDRLMEIQFLTFEDDPYQKYVYGRNTPSERASAAKRTLKEWHNDPSMQILKCTELDTNVIVGYAIWHIYRKERPEREWKQEIEIDGEGRPKEIGVNFLRMTFGIREKIWEGRPHCLLAILCVHPNYQRRGAGTLLIQWGLDKASRLGLPAYLEASREGYYLYRKMGFHEIDAAVIKAKDWDGDYDRRYPAMLKT